MAISNSPHHNTVPFVLAMETIQLSCTDRYQFLSDFFITDCCSCVIKICLQIPLFSCLAYCTFLFYSTSLKYQWLLNWYFPNSCIFCLNYIKLLQTETCSSFESLHHWGVNKFNSVVKALNLNKILLCCMNVEFQFDVDIYCYQAYTDGSV